jgi:ribosomal protein S18 acetylase RimI-like enzyme
MLRPTVPDDTPLLKRLTAATGFFKPHEIDALQEVLDEYHAENAAEGHVCRTNEHDGELLGFVYFAPAPMALGTWELWWIVVKPSAQARGLGGEMLRYAEEEVRCRQGRVLFVETSSQPLYDLTRRFYVRHGYEEHAVLKDYYAAGDSMVVFRKAIETTRPCET